MIPATKCRVLCKLDVSRRHVETVSPHLPPKHLQTRHLFTHVSFLQNHYYSHHHFHPHKHVVCVSTIGRLGFVVLFVFVRRLFFRRIRRHHFLFRKIVHQNSIKTNETKLGGSGTATLDCSHTMSPTLLICGLILFSPSKDVICPRTLE
jgi:hypothetical protein